MVRGGEGLFAHDDVRLAPADRQSVPEPGDPLVALRVAPENQVVRGEVVGGREGLR